MSSVADFPLPATKAIDLIRQSVREGTYLMPARFAEDEWPHVVYRRSAQRCLEEGEIIKGPVVNNRGHYEYQMYRLSAGQELYLTVVLYKGPDWVVRVLEAKTHD